MRLLILLNLLLASATLMSAPIRTIMGARNWIKTDAAEPLPYDAEVEWIRLHAGPKIILDFYPTTNTVLKTRAAITYSSGGRNFGTVISEYKNYRIFMSGDSLYFDLGAYNTQGRCSIGNKSLGTVYDMEFGNYYIAIDGEEVVRKKSSSTVLAEGAFVIVNVKVYYLQIFENGTLIYDMIPVRVGDEGFLYNKVTGEMYGNVSTSGNKIVVGPDK